MKQRSLYYLSDRTGITAEVLGHSLITQFDNISWRKQTIPFLDNVEKAQAAVKRIDAAAQDDGVPPLLFSTLVDSDVRAVIEQSQGILYDFFDAFIAPMEKELGQKSLHAIGRSHGIVNDISYLKRIGALNYALAHDDGAIISDFESADIILIGVSRSGKTPTCLNLALQYGIAAANYPLTEEDMEWVRLPKLLQPFKDKLYGLWIEPIRLHKIRQERRPNSRYASLTQCKTEMLWLQQVYRHERIPYLNTTAISIEEITTTILHQARLKRQLYG
jgi:regulator of PEP synthase PpsR (kinase-PPPase family)